MHCVRCNCVHKFHFVVDNAHDQGIDKESKQDPTAYWNLRENCNFTGKGTTLMILDTGIDEDHPSFKKDRLLLPPDGYDDEHKHLHGTLCAAIACGDEVDVENRSSSFKCRGVAHEAKLGIWKKSTIGLRLRPLIDYINNERHRIDVLVIVSGFDDSDEMHDSIKELDDMGIIIVCSGSNEGHVNADNVTYPAHYEETICVGSHDRYGNRIGYSAVGSTMDFLAFGEKVAIPRKATNQDPKSSQPFERRSGTSYAAPALGGLICLIIQALRVHKLANEKLNRQFIVELLKLLTNKESGVSRDSLHGYGAISPKKLKEFFGNPKCFINKLDQNLLHA